MEKKIYMLQNNYRYAGILQLAEENAKDNKIGIWSEERVENNSNNDSYQGNGQVNWNIVGIIAILILLMIGILIGNRKQEKTNK